MQEGAERTGQAQEQQREERAAVVVGQRWVDKERGRAREGCRAGSGRAAHLCGRRVVLPLGLQGLRIARVDRLELGSVHAKKPRSRACARPQRRRYWQRLRRSLPGRAATQQPAASHTPPRARGCRAPGVAVVCNHGGLQMTPPLLRSTPPPAVPGARGRAKASARTSHRGPAARPRPRPRRCVAYLCVFLLSATDSGCCWWAPRCALRRGPPLLGTTSS
jgi:hypothetical protein